jgi:hypothetical protein
MTSMTQLLAYVAWLSFAIIVLTGVLLVRLADVRKAALLREC